MAYERLSAQDTTFLHIENPTQPQHVGSLALFEAAPFFDANGVFKLDEARALIAGRLHLVPRFRKKLMTVAFEQGRPVWVDDETFDLAYHVRLTALPAPGTEAQLKALFSRLQGHLLDRNRPLWELWFVEGLHHDRIALIQKTHHSLVDGISGVDVATVLLDLTPEPTVLDVPGWTPEQPPSSQQLLTESVLQRATEPVEMARSIRAALRVPRQMAGRLAGVGRTLATSVQRPPEMPWNAPISAHRRWENARVPLTQVKAVREAATASKLTAGRCSINDVVVAACSGALRSFLQDREVPVEGLVLKAMIPVSMRSEDEAGTLGNRVSMVPADLPVGEADPLWRLRIAHDNMSELKASGAAVAGEDLIRMTSYLPPTVLASASRLLARNVPVNTTITNIPGPQFPLYCMGAKMLEAFPYVGIVDGMALTIAVLSYDGNLGFGITGDRDLLPDLALLAGGIEDAFAELEEAVGAPAARKNGAKP